MLSTVLIRGESPAASACGASNCCYSRTVIENAHEANLAGNENDSLEYSVRPGRNRWGGGARSRCGPCFSSGAGETGERGQVPCGCRRRRIYARHRRSHWPRTEGACHFRIFGRGSGPFRMARRLRGPGSSSLKRDYEEETRMAADQAWVDRRTMRYHDTETVGASVARRA